MESRLDPPRFIKRPFTMISSSTTGGASWFTLVSDGSTTTSPLLVAKQMRPSASLPAAGCRPPEHSTDGRPSPSPYVRQAIDEDFPSAQLFRDFFEMRAT